MLTQNHTSEAAASERSRGVHPLRWFLRLSWGGRGLALSAALVVLIGAFYAEENWRGRRAWAACQQDLAARGVELDWRKFNPPPVPDDQNFALTPFLAPLFDFNPGPRDPGQSRWRDLAGHDRATEFGAKLLTGAKAGDGPSFQLDGQRTDLPACLALLRKEAKSSTASPVFPTRADAAAAVMEALQPYQAVLSELRSASHRPFSRFNIEYNADDPMSILLPHLGVLRHVARTLEIQASAELALGKTEAAFDDVRLIFFIADSIQPEPFLISHSVRSSLLNTGMQIIWEGLAQHRWSDDQLRDFQTRLAAIHLVADLNRALAAERAAFGNPMLRFIQNHKNALRDWIANDDSAAPLTYLLGGPTGWLYQEQVSYQRLYDQRILPALDVRAGQVHPRIADDDYKLLTNDLAGSSFWHHTALAKLVLPQLVRMFQRTAVVQSTVNQAVVACALERDRLAEGNYPPTQAALVPRYTDTLPAGACDGQPLSYQPAGPNKFALYDVGWNLTDDHGVVSLAGDGATRDLTHGDWVWPPYPD
jgi:hypothetical protein